MASLFWQPAVIGTLAVRIRDGESDGRCVRAAALRGELQVAVTTANLCGAPGRQCRRSGQLEGQLEGHWSDSVALSNCIWPTLSSERLSHADSSSSLRTGLISSETPIGQSECTSHSSKRLATRIELVGGAGELCGSPIAKNKNKNYNKRG